MAPTKSSKAPPPDFKRIKAKVGKRAPKPANLTDTSFKAASVSVRQQSVAVSTSSQGHDELISSRGNTIADLTAQLQHPAPTARLSAAKGLKDMVQSSRSDVLWNHLSLLLPVIAKCFVDSEEQVRELGLGTLKDLLSLLGPTASSALTPFASLLLATVSCALNSLDQDTRKHGAMALELLCRSCPRVVAPHVGELLPALVRLVSQTQFFKQTDTNPSEPARGAAKKKKPTKHRATDNEFSVASALLSLLSTVTIEYESNYDEPLQKEADLVIMERSCTQNALVLLGHRHPKRRLVELESVTNMSKFLSNQQDDWKPELSHGILPKTALDLMNSFRDALIDVSQKGLSTATDVGTLLMLCKSIRHFWELAQGQLLVDDGPERGSLEKSCRQVVKLILEIFPVQPSTSDRAGVDELNATFCGTIFSFASTKSFEKDSERWKKRVSSHVIQSLESMGAMDPSKLMENQVPILKVLQQLLMDKEQRPEEMKTRRKLIKHFCRVYFEESKVMESLAKSLSGRVAVQLGSDLIRSQRFDFNLLEREYGSSALDIVRQMPTYLIAWRHDYPLDTYKTLVLLHDIARQSQLSDGLFKGVKSKLESLLMGNAPCTLELLPEGSQRLLVSLMVMGGSPSNLCLKGLGQICMRSRWQQRKCVTSLVTSFIIHSLHSIRRQIPMQQHLTFVTDSTGIASCTESVLIKEATQRDGHPWKAMLSYDCGVRDACLCYIDCGSSRVLQMLIPLLSAWLNTCHDWKSVKTCDLLRLRTALTLLAYFHCDVQEYSGSSVWNILPIEVHKLAWQAVANIVCCTPVMEQEQLAVTTNDVFSRWVRPIQVLLGSHQNCLLGSCSAVCAKMVELDSKSQIAAITCLSELCNSQELASMVASTCTDLLARLEQLSIKLTKESPASEQVDLLAARIELIHDQWNQSSISSD